MAARVTRVAMQVAGFQDAGGLVVPESPGTIFTTLKRNNWLTNVHMERAWQTDVVIANSSGAEERWALRKRPLMTQRAQLTGMEQNESADLLMHLARQGQHGNPTPIFPDRTRLTAVYSGGTRVFCDTTYRRFFNGQRIAVVPRDWGVVQVSGAFAPTEYTFISAVTSTYIDITSPFTAAGGYGVGAWIFPLFDAEVVLDIQYNRATRAIIDGTVTWIERSGGGTIPSFLNSPHVPVEVFDTYLGLPILDSAMNGEIKGSVERSGTRYPSGRASVTEVYGELARFSIEADFRCITRAAWWRLTSFFDTVRGRWGAFYFVNPQRLWTLERIISSTVIRVQRTHYYHLFDPGAAASADGRPPWLEWFAVTEKDGTLTIVKITDVTEISQDVWEITVDAPMPTSNILKLTAAHKARLVEDSMADQWFTFDVVTTSLKLLEVHDEEAVVFTGL